MVDTMIAPPVEGLKRNERFAQLASEASITRAAEALRGNGFVVILTQDGDEARREALALLPQGAQVFALSSRTLDEIGLSRAINEDGRFNSVRKKMASLDPKVHADELRRLGAAPDYAVGSVQALTEQGQFLIASKTGSQLPASASGAGKVIWIVGAQKIVADLDEGMRRLVEYSLPMEDERARKAYGVGSAINKILIINREIRPGRATVILVRQKLGF